MSAVCVYGSVCCAGSLLRYNIRIIWMLTDEIYNFIYSIKNIIGNLKDFRT